jgi:SAM-dependent methyltransferase
MTVHGLELSPDMAGQLRSKPGAEAVPVTIGDMTTARVPGAPFTLVYLVANTIMNVTTQDAQLAVFANAASHLDPGGCFVVEVIVPQLRRVPPGEMARIAGFRLRDRWAGWDRAPFTSASQSQVAVFEKRP